MGVNRELVRAPMVHIELLRVNDADVPHDMWDRVMDRVREHVAGEIVVMDHGCIELPADERGDLLERFDWPFADQFGEAVEVTVQSMRKDDRNWLPIDSHLVHAMALVTERNESGEIMHEWIEMRVPADASHTTMKLGTHCTYPHCVMYSPVDLRWFASLFLNGWPMELCQVCTEEIRLVREDEDGATERDIARFHAPPAMEVMCCSP